LPRIGRDDGGAEGCIGDRTSSHWAKGRDLSSKTTQDCVQSGSREEVKRVIIDEERKKASLCPKGELQPWRVSIMKFSMLPKHAHFKQLLKTGQFYSTRVTFWQARAHGLWASGRRSRKLQVARDAHAERERK